MGVPHEVLEVLQGISFFEGLFDIRGDCLGARVAQERFIAQFGTGEDVCFLAAYGANLILTHRSLSFIL